MNRGGSGEASIPQLRGDRRSRTASRSATSATGGAVRRSCCCQPGRLCRPGIGRCRLRIWPGISRWRALTAGAAEAPAAAEPAAYTDAQFASDAIAVMDAAGIETAVLVSVSCGTLWALRLGAEHPDRVLGSVFIAPTAPLVPPLAERRVQRFGEILDNPVGWQTYNARYWKTHYPEFVTLLYGAHLHRAALDETGRGRHRMGAGDRRRDAGRGAPRPRMLRRRGDPPAWPRGLPARFW